jgi:uncharacterized transporter YbjL
LFFRAIVLNLCSTIPYQSPIVRVQTDAPTGHLVDINPILTLIGKRDHRRSCREVCGASLNEPKLIISFIQQDYLRVKNVSILGEDIHKLKKVGRIAECSVQRDADR